MPRPSSILSERILSASVAEFSAYGFAGARVDRIARKARVSKGMIYYHFRSKIVLYQSVVQRIYTGLLGRLEPVSSTHSTPAQQIEETTAAIGNFFQQNPAYSVIMLRELVEGGQHLDAETLRLLGLIRRAVFSAVQQAPRGGSLRNIPPVFVYYLIFAPTLVFTAGARIRARLAELHVPDVPTGDTVAPEVFIRHLQATLASVLKPSLTRKKPRTAAVALGVDTQPATFDR